MDFRFDNNTPIYIQLVEQIKLNIISGRLSPGERLPSVRELAMKTKVNPNTMQKALSELEEAGLIYTERTNGKFVTEDTALIENYKTKHAHEAARKYLAAMAELGYSNTAAADFLSREENKQCHL